MPSGAGAGELPEPARSVLELARWAPSADNTQPWRFDVHGGTTLTVFGRDTRDTCVYDLDGRITQIAFGALLETITIAAAGLGYRADARLRPVGSERDIVADVELVPDGSLPCSAAATLCPLIPVRTVQRRPLRTRPVPRDVRAALEESLGDGHAVVWFEGWRDRWRYTCMNVVNGRLRLMLPEAFDVHRSVVHWDVTHSSDRIPAPAIGLDPATLLLMRWAFASWRRVRFLNRYLAGTLIPTIELDFLPGLLCAAHFVIVAKRPLRNLDEYVAGGRAVQRFWLSAARLGLQFQPEVSPLVFARYRRDGTAFTGDRYCEQRADAVTEILERLVEREQVENAVFAGRIGFGSNPLARSVRLQLEELLDERQ